MCVTMDTGLTKTIAIVVTNNKVPPAGVVPEHRFPFSPDGALLGPSDSDIDCVDGVDEHSGQGYTAMGNGIGFDEAGAGLVPLVGLDGDLVSEQCSWFGRASSSFLILDANGIQEPVFGRHRDLQ